MVIDLQQLRFHGDLESARALVAHADISRYLKRYSEDRADSARKDLLAHSVRIDEEILPELDKAIREIHERVGVRETIECYVFDNSSINACVFPSGNRMIALLSSGAIEKLTPEELEFVIGHEIGHVVYDHCQIPVGRILESEENVPAKDAIALLAWQRQSEISADRAGLACCGSLDVAASAFSKP